MLLARRETTERLALYDEKGLPVGSVNLPIDPRPFGPDKETVYLARPLPTLPESGQSAQAA
jgi:hypothetical protein